MKVLIIGNSGFIGSFLTDSLVKAGHEVVGMDINAPISKDNLSDFMLSDILDPEKIMKATQGTDAIIHLAAKHHDFGVSREEFFNVNVSGMRNILNCVTKLGIKKLIFYSTAAVYGNTTEYRTETTVLQPISPYGESKLAAERILCEWASQDEARQVVIIRPTVVFGPGNYANMYNLIDKIYKKRFIFVGKCDNVKSVAYVENLVEATVFLFERLRFGVHIYNYSDYPQMTAGEIVKTITKHLSYKVPNFRVPLKPGLAVASIFDILAKFTGYNFPITANRIKKFNTSTPHNSDKIRKEGFIPPVQLSEGFKRMVKWYLKNRDNHKVVKHGSGEED